jgi:SPP1 family predicted phage head-tail adaptor
MRAGNLDRVIEIQRRSITPDLYGAIIDVWTTIARIRAQKLENTTDDREGARGSTTDTVITFRTRWLDGVTLENRIIYEGKLFQITRIKEVGRRVGLDIMCERVGP